jgi:hypothetical protein
MAFCRGADLIKNRAITLTIAEVSVENSLAIVMDSWYEYRHAQRVPAHFPSGLVLTEAFETVRELRTFLCLVRELSHKQREGLHIPCDS